MPEKDYRARYQPQVDQLRLAATDYDQYLSTYIRHFEDSIVDEDDDVLIVNKPPHVISIASDNFPIGMEEIAQYVRQAPIYIAHRLDIGTSGLLVMTKNKKAASIVQPQFEHKENSPVKKRYLAIAEGIINDAIVIRGYIAYFGGKKKGRIVDEFDTTGKNKKWSETYIQPYPQITLGSRYVTPVDVNISTGRKHQIRVALHHLGHPIVGDTTYKGQHHESDRPLLHSYELSLWHPSRNEIVQYQAPIPQDMQFAFS